MKLRAVYDKAEDIPEALKEFFKEVDGKHLLQAEGMKTQSDIDNLQEALRKEREDHAAEKLKVKDAQAELNQAKDKLTVLEKSGGKTDDDREPTNAEMLELLQLRRDVEALTADRDKLKVDYDGLSSEVTTNQVKAELRKEFAKHIRSEALEREVEIAASKFVISDGKALTSADLGSNGGLTAEAFATNVVKEQPFLAVPSNSGGAKGGQGGSPTGDAPMSRKEYLASQGVQ